MQVTFKKGNPMDVKADVLVLPVYEETWEESPLLLEADKALDGLLLPALKSRDFKAKADSRAAFDTWGKLAAGKLVVAGVGKADEQSADSLWTFASNAVSKLHTKGMKTAAMAYTFAGDDPKKTLQLLATGLLTGSYSFDKYKKKDNKTGFSKLSIVAPKENFKGNGKEALEKGLALGEAINFSRTLVNTPTEDMNPSHLAQAAKSLVAKDEKDLKVQVRSEAEIKKLKMDLYLAVARTAANPPKLITLEWKPKGTTRQKPLVVVGKGLMYDTGGLSLKPSTSMDTMKCDMAGSAAVLGLFHFLVHARPNRRVVGVIAACENAIGGKSYRPGDVFTSRRGISVEVLNTDAEGRLTLADALDFAQTQYKPAQMIDLATLTGACVVALGESTVGLMSNNEEFSGKIGELAEKAGEDFWPLPLNPKYEKLIKSDFADIKNVGGRWGGALTAGLFLKRFVDDDLPWAHLDIAGPAYTATPFGHLSKYATGVGVAMLAEWVLDE